MKIKVLDNNRLLFICINRETHREHAIMVDFKGNLIANTPVSEPIEIIKSSGNSQTANAAKMQYKNEQILLYNKSLKLLTMECSRFLSFEIIFPAKTYPNMEINERIVKVIYDKKSKRTFTLKYHKDFGASGFTNDIDRGMPFNPSFIFNNRMYQVVDAANFIEYAKRGSSTKMKEIAAQLTDDSNSVVVAATLK